MYLKRVELLGFKSFAKKIELVFDASVTAIVGPNGSGKSNVAEAFRWVLGEQSMKSLRGKRGEDLIFNGSVKQARLNKAKVTLVFDNKERHFKIDFDEVLITREVFRDGVNNYYLNGSRVRLKDVVELLADVSLGSSGHHIISQGEADRVLLASPIVRKEIIEDALGLKIYQIRKKESERKLLKTEENIREVNLLRRELSPHLKFLQKQIEKRERSKELRQKLVSLYKEYFKREELYLSENRQKLAKERESPALELAVIKKEIELGDESGILNVGGEFVGGELQKIESELLKTRGQKDELSFRLGRVEGRIDALTQSGFLSEPVSVESEVSKCFYCGTILQKDISGARESFRQKKREELDKLAGDRRDIEQVMSQLIEKEREQSLALDKAKQKAHLHSESLRDKEKKGYELRARQNELLSRLDLIKSKEERILHEESDFKRELGEAGMLIGREVMEYVQLEIDLSLVVGESRDVQETRRREIERLKIRMEDLGGIGEEVVKEYEETLARDNFLASEVSDLIKSAESLRSLMVDLSAKIEDEFKVGVQKINSQFQSFFESLFGGGRAAVVVVDVERPVIEGDGEPEKEIGIEIDLTLPKKKLRGLQMLSGGERSLVSIALLFAISQVKPPPFLILDETDAALDEANSKKYGDMIEGLSRFSQLIIITHNRETMSRANILYGITMGDDGTSRVLSIKFDDAKQMAAR